MRAKCDKSVLFFVIFCSISTLYGGYLVTTPRRWTSEESSQVCITLSKPATAEDFIEVALKEKDFGESNPNASFILNFQKLVIPAGESSICNKVLLPKTQSQNAEIFVKGLLTGSTLNYSKPISISTDVGETFIQTDKYLYKPSQNVQFRILTVEGPYLKVSTDQYTEIWLETPTGTRIAQWLDVPNDSGLIHLSFTLSDEPEEGTYKIQVRSPFDKSIKSQTFKVEEYVLPKYEVKIKKPGYVLGTSETITFKVCAKYTFGQPVKGNVTLTVDNNGWGNYKITIEKNSTISGCEKFVINSTELDLNREEYFAYSLNANAVVTEEGTGVKLEAKRVSVDVTRTALSFKDIGVQQFYKPEIPFIGEVLVTLPDESPAAQEKMEVCCGRTVCRNLTTNVNGVLKYIVPPHLNDSIYIKALNYQRVPSNNTWRSIMYESTFSKSIKKYHSPSNSSLVIATTNEDIECLPSAETIDFKLPVRFSAAGLDSANMSVQVVSRGQIQFSKVFKQPLVAGGSLHIDESLLLEPLKEPVTKNVLRGQFDIPISLPKTVSPKAKVIIWYTRSDGEVVSDAREIDITECLLNAVNLTWSTEKVQPGEDATLKLEAAPLSLCSLGVVDKSVQLLSSKTAPTVKAFLDVAEKSSVSDYENLMVDDFQYCKGKYDDTPIDPVTLPPILPPVALPVARRAKRSFRPWWPYYSDDVDALHMFDVAGIYAFSDLTLETRPCRRRYGENFPFSSPVAVDGVALADAVSITAGAPLPSPEAAIAVNKGTAAAAENSGSDSPRTYFPETWLWQIKPVTETGVSEERLTLPDSVTEWVGSAVCVHPTKGVGISPTASITTFRDFFADLTLPPSVKRGEVFPVKISVFNYLKEPLPITVILEESTEYDILAETGEAIGTGQRSSCLPSEDKTVHEVRIRPKEIGDVNITVTAFVDANAIDNCGQASGKLRRDTLIKPIRVEIEGFPKEKVWSQYICTQDLTNGEDAVQSWQVETPASIIPDSARGFVAVVGDLMGPTLDNLGSLVQMPYGCGEQNMLNFAPNIFVMQYLDASNQNNEETAKKAIEFMEKGYQRELKYRHSDGSFSAFGESDDSGSTWLTAFVLKSFAQARPYISIDATDLDISRNWLKTKQMENGCFELVGKVLHKGMKGGLQNSDSPALLSAFVLIALLEAGEPQSSPAVREALFCLNAEEPTRNPYSLAVKAYALALAGSPDANATLNNLLSVATADSSIIYWTLPAEYESSNGVGVETAGYAVLALLAQISKNGADSAPQVRQIVKWMNNQRNGQGGFVSTQDTIVALQAMAEFEKTMPQGPTDLSLVIGMGATDAPFTVNEKNKLLQQKATIPSFPTTVTTEIAGEGCALVQAVLRYNVPEAESNEAFRLRVETATEPDKGCKTKRITACASYLLKDLKSNMAIIEVKLVSGYIPVKADLKQLVGYETGLFKRYEVDGSLVTIYVDEFSPEEICASFKIVREVDVEDPKPGSVKVYDYYKPEYSVSEKYTLPPPTDCIDESTVPLAIEKEIVVGADEVATTTTAENLRAMLDAFDEAVV